MKLSEAIRLGAMATRQGRGSRSMFSTTAPCALGAARLAADIPMPRDDYQYTALRERWPVLNVRVRHPSCLHDAVVVHLSTAIAALNDYHGWTREQIADWVENVEQAHEDAPESVGAALTEA